MESLSNCPLCNSGQLAVFLECTDYTVSKSKFKITECGACGFRFTNPRPEESKAGEYYKSDDYISHSNTAKGIINTIYQRVRRITLKKKRQLIITASGKNSGSLLDLGCGTGEFANECARNSWQVKGIEPSANAREFAKKQYGLDVYDAGAWSALPDRTFDVVTAWHVLEHVYDLKGTLNHISRLLKQDGMLVIALPNCSSADAQFYKEFWAAYDVPRHIWHFTPAHVKTLFEKNGFTLQSVLPMPFDAYYISMLSEKYKGGNVNYGRALVHGYFSNRAAKKTGNTCSSQIYILKPVK